MTPAAGGAPTEKKTKTPKKKANHRRATPKKQRACR
jgi:hypothetical protein